MSSASPATQLDTSAYLSQSQAGGNRKSDEVGPVGLRSGLDVLVAKHIVTSLQAASDRSHMLYLL